MKKWELEQGEKANEDINLKEMNDGSNKKKKTQLSKELKKKKEMPIREKSD